MFKLRTRKTSAPDQLPGPAASAPKGTRGRPGGKTRIAGMAGFSAVALTAALGATSTATAAQEPPTGGGGAWSCDAGGFDPWFPAPLAPDNPTWNPAGSRTETQLYQFHTWREDTYAEATTTRQHTYIYIEDKKSGQKCRSGKNAMPNGFSADLETEYLDNRNTSLRTCIVEPQMEDPKCGAWYREDSGGHRQLDFDGHEILDYDIDDDATVSYDGHETSRGGRATPDEYSVPSGHGSARLYVNEEYEYQRGRAYAQIYTRNKNEQIRLDSDKYGKGEWRSPNEFTHLGWRGTSGVLYNDNDRLRVVVKKPNGDVVKGKWRSGKGVVD